MSDAQTPENDASAERSHHRDCPVNYWPDKPQRCRCVFMAMLDQTRPVPPVKTD